MEIAKPFICPSGVVRGCLIYEETSEGLDEVEFTRYQLLSDQPTLARRKPTLRWARATWVRRSHGMAGSMCRLATPPAGNWDDARKCGYICAGGGTWYSQTLKLLSPGDRVWVNVPKKGYVGVGIVEQAVQPASDFMVTTDQGEKLVMEVAQHGAIYKANAGNPELSEYFVKVEWLDTVDTGQAFNEVGLFGNQNTVCQPTTPKWRHTVERLKNVFIAVGA